MMTSGRWISGAAAVGDSGGDPADDGCWPQAVSTLSKVVTSTDTGSKVERRIMVSSRVIDRL
jgi:hypothetical protein